jgi:acyl carrier protein
MLPTPARRAWRIQPREADRMLKRETSSMTIEEKIRQYVAENFLFSDDGYQLSDDASFLENGIVDSTGVLELVMFVEEIFEIRVEDDEILPENFDSVSYLARYVRDKVA